MKYTVVRTDTADEQIRKIILYINENFGSEFISNLSKLGCCWRKSNISSKTGESCSLNSNITIRPILSPPNTRLLTSILRLMTYISSMKQKYFYLRKNFLCYIKTDIR